MFEKDISRGVNADHVRKIKVILTVMNAARDIADLDQATFHLQPLVGDLKGYWSVTVRSNWRIIFRLEDGQAFDVDLVDYH